MSCKYCAKSTCHGECQSDLTVEISKTEGILSTEEIISSQIDVKIIARNTLADILGDFTPETEQKIQKLIDAIILASVLEIASAAVPEEKE